MNVLLVEDDSSRMRDIKRNLEKVGMHVITAEDGFEARKKLNDYPIDVILSDINIPYGDGYSLAMKVKKDNRLKSIKFLMYSSREIIQDSITLAKEIGVDFCLSTKEPQAITDEALNFLKI